MEAHSAASRKECESHNLCIIPSLQKEEIHSRWQLSHYGARAPARWRCRRLFASCQIIFGSECTLSLLISLFPAT